MIPTIITAKRATDIPAINPAVIAESRLSFGMPIVSVVSVLVALSAES